LRPNELDRLWGSILEDLRVDLREQAAEFRIRVVTGDSSTYLTVRSVGLKRFEYETDIPGPWNYAEITAAYLDEGGRRLSFVLWAEGTTLVVDADGHYLNESDRHMRLG
jgi:hypothetical protein